MATKIRVKLDDDQRRILLQRLQRYQTLTQKAQEAGEVFSNMCELLAGEDYEFDMEKMQLFRTVEGREEPSDDEE